MKTVKKINGTAHAFFDHSSSIEDLRNALEKINNNPDVSQKARYELHHENSELELDVGLQEVINVPDDYRVMSKDLRKDYPAEDRRKLGDHRYVLVAISEDGHEKTADELEYTMNQLHQLNYDRKIFRGAIVHKNEKRNKYHVR